jgi:hypothetical protein
LREEINAELLRMRLQKQHGQTRLVLLNACLGALPAGDDPFSSVGAALLRGVPAVIAMQFELAAEIYDPTKGAWQPTANLTTEGGGDTATVQPDGTALVARGWKSGNLNGLANDEVYTPPKSP